MIQRVREGPQLLLALPDLPVELVSVPLELLPVLRRLDDVVGLGVLGGAVVVIRSFVLMNERFVLDPQIFHFVLPLL